MGLVRRPITVIEEIFRKSGKGLFFSRWSRHCYNNITLLRAHRPTPHAPSLHRSEPDQTAVQRAPLPSRAIVLIISWWTLHENRFGFFILMHVFHHYHIAKKTKVLKNIYRLDRIRSTIVNE